MNDYGLRLVMEGLCEVFGKEGLEDGTHAKRELCRMFAISEEIAEALIEGAHQLTLVREVKPRCQILNSIH